MKKTKAVYRSAPHKAARKAAAKVVEAGAAYCAEPICLMTSRWIPPGSDWDLSHNEAGTRYIGPSHATCNRSEGARRMHQMRKAKQKRWAL